MIQDQIPAVKALSPRDKLALAVELWDELAAHPEEVPVTEAQLGELDRRHEEYLANPEAVGTWETVKARLQQRSR